MSYEIKVGDLDPPIRATLKDQDMTVVDLTGGTVTFRWRLRGSSSWTSGSASITSAAAGTVSYRFTTGQTDVAGTYESEWKVTTSGNPRTYPSHEYELFYIND
jgi:autotransporter translocation and assembly factor TamB